MKLKTSNVPTSNINPNRRQSPLPLILFKLKILFLFYQWHSEVLLILENLEQLGPLVM